MDPKAGSWLIAPNLKNASCSHPRYIGSFLHNIGPIETIQALIIFMLTVGIIGANLLVIFVINHRRYSPYIHPQVCVVRVLQILYIHYAGKKNLHGSLISFKNKWGYIYRYRV